MKKKNGEKISKLEIKDPQGEEKEKRGREGEKEKRMRECERECE